MNWKRALPGLLFAALSYALYAVNVPPIPPVPARPHKSAAIHQGAGAAALIVKPLIITLVSLTNSVVWQYPPSVNPSNLWWNIESSTDLYHWEVAISNASGQSAINVKPTEPLRVFRLSGRTQP